ncbi:MAG: DUF4390 domain-containing protein [Gammaproteobacteria bacterium]|jgi:hypothetical protein
MFRQTLNLTSSPRRILFLLGMALLLTVQVAQAAEPSFEVRRAESYLRDGVYRIDAELRYRLGPDLDQALRNGVALTIGIEMQVYRPRNWWFSEDVADVSLRYRLSYHALTTRYVVTNLNTDVRHSYPTLGAALYDLGQVRDFPLIDNSLLQPGRDYRVRIRSAVAIQDLPLPLRVRAYFSDAWGPESEWYTWPLR